MGMELFKKYSSTTVSQPVERRRADYLYEVPNKYSCMDDTKNDIIKK
jgi:hypothetical protein